MGYRLGPQDVQTCPVLPAVRMVAERLRQARFAVIVGESGAGKSITAFQAAYELNRQGWAVVELSQPGVASNETVRTFTSLRGPVVAVVDDAQALALDVLSAFERAVSADHAVVVVVTERVPGQDRVQVSSVQAVATLVQYCEAHVDEFATMVGEIDDRVGYEIGREPFPRRVEAAKSSHYPRQFMYVLSGGERRIRDALANLAGEGDADLLFGILAAAQLLSLDAGISQDALLQYSEFVGWDDQWLEHGLATLAEHRLVINHRERLRTPHMRIADRGLLVLCRDHGNPQWRTLIAFLRSRLVDPAEPLQGKLWTLQAINQSDPLRYCHPELLLDEEVAALLVDACLAAPHGHERNIAAYLLWEIDRWRALSQPMAKKVTGVLPGWILEATADDIYGICWLFGGLRSNFPELHGVISSRVQPEQIAQRLEEHGTPGSGESWGKLLARLAHAEGVDSNAWAARFQDAVDTDRVAARVRSAPATSSLRGNVEFVHHLVGFAPRVAAAAVAAMTPALSQRLQRDVTGAARDLVPWAFSLFDLMSSQDETFWETEVDYRTLRDVVMDLVAATNWETVGTSLTRAQLHEMDQIDLLTFSIHRFAPDALTRMMSAISLDDLDGITEGHWHDFTKIERLVVSLGYGEDHEPARSWVQRHRDQIGRMPTLIVPIAPRVAAELVARGGQIQLDVSGGLWWGECAEALAALLAEDRTAALAVVNSSRAAIFEGLALRQANMTEHFLRFVVELDALDPNFLVELLNTLDPEMARQHWSERLAGSSEEAAAANLLIDRALLTSGQIRVVAQELRDASDEPVR